jgi:dihydroxy-acid dehydratase
VKLGIADARRLRFEGRANIYHSRDEAIDGLNNGEIKPGQVVVLRGMGVKGGPGMAMASALVFALDGAGLSEQVAVVTDGQLSGLVNRGLVVGEISPEAAEGGPLALVENGDAICIDVEKKVVNLEVPEPELAARRARWREPAPTAERGWLSIYRRVVQPLPKGAVLTK